MIDQASSSRIAKTFRIARSSFSNPRDTPFDACGSRQVEGNLQQRSTIDQFHNSYRSLGSQYETPSAMCGYFSVANALVLSRELPPRWNVTCEELEHTFSVLENLAEVDKEAEHIMSFLQQHRKSYVNSNLSDFHGPSDVAHYMSDWVANYEISDYLVALLKQDSLAESIHFLRYNQMPEFETATHEERVRLEDERCFGTAVPGGSDSKMIAELEPGATRFFVERFLPEHDLLRPEHWLQQGIQLDAAPPVFVVDIDGHFVAAVPLILGSSAESQGGPTLLVVNTTTANYLQSPAVAYLFDLAFGERQS